MADGADLVNRMRRHMLDAIMRPAYEALGQAQADRIRVQAERLVEHGHAVAAEALVRDEVTLHALQAEISRHIPDCATCHYLPDLECLELARLSSREYRLLNLVAGAEGLP